MAAEGIEAIVVAFAWQPCPFSTVCSSPDVPPPSTRILSIARGRDSRLYHASDYGENLREFEMPSAILRRFAERADQVGIISIGELRASFSPDEAALANMVAPGQIDTLVSWLRFAGIKVESSADLARSVCKTHGVWTGVSAEFIRRYVRDKNGALPNDKKIKVTLDAIRSGQDLSVPGDDPTGYLFQIRHRGQLTNWSSTSVRGVEENKKRKRPISTSSARSDVSLRPKPKMERPDAKGSRTP